MRSIYPGAVKTFLHIGRSDDFPSTLVYWAKYVCGSIQFRFLPKLFADPRTRPAMLWWWLRLVLTDLKGGDFFMRALVYRGCWVRTWILQEASLSPEVEVICRNVTIKWDHFERIVYGYVKHLTKSRERLVHVVPKCFGSFFAFNSVVKAVKRQDGSTLLLLLLLSNTMRASDPRDRIYALLALASDAQEFPRSDYSLAVTDVYQTFALALVAKGHGPDILALASCGARYRRYPSWVPDWEQEFIGLRLQMVSSFSAGGSDGHFDVPSGTFTISTQGFVVDTVLRIYSLDADRLFDDDAVLEELLALVSSTAAAIRIDTELSRISFSWSSVADLHLMLILYLVFDHDGNAFFAPSPLRDALCFDEFVTKVLLAAPTARLLREDDTKEAHDATLARVLSDHLRRGYGEKSYCFVEYLLSVARRGRFAISLTGRLCLIPLDVQLGDKIAVIRGCRAPYVLREDGDGFLNIGETYIRGLMHGEAMDDERYTLQEILVH